MKSAPLMVTRIDSILLRSVYVASAILFDQLISYPKREEKNQMLHHYRLS